MFAGALGKRRRVVPSSVKVAGLFAGIGGIELGFQRALGQRVETTLLCEWWDPARRVLAERFPDVPIYPDVRTLAGLPAGLDVVTAGFPCTDLSQAGRTAGIGGEQSGLVDNLFTALRSVDRREGRLPWLLIENVSNMLVLDRGRAMRHLVDELEGLGYRWAYRVVDSRFAGVPQRRRRVLLLASRTDDPRAVLFADDAGPLRSSWLWEDAFGFYWTEGARGLGWARDAIPTFKGGSTVGIPSAPAVWLPGAEPELRFVTPSISDAEELQGFERGWTAAAGDRAGRNGPRWKLVGNAVTTGVAEWVARRLAAPGTFDRESQPWAGSGGWPVAAWGESGRVFRVGVSEFPTQACYRHLREVVRVEQAHPLTHRSAAGFWNRLQRGNLGRHPGFRADVGDYVAATRPARERAA